MHSARKSPAFAKTKTRICNKDDNIIRMIMIINNYYPEGGEQWWIYTDTKRHGIYLALSTDHEGDSCFSIYHNNGIKMHFM